MDNKSVQDKPLLIIILFLLVLLAINMRSPIVMLGSLADTLDKTLGLSSLYLGYLGALPLPLFALAALITPYFMTRFGLIRLIVVATTILTMAIFLRVWAGIIGLFIGTFVLSLMIGMLNVAVAPFIKQYLPNHITVATGIFSLSMSVSAGILAWLVVPLSKTIGWQFSLSMWAIFTALSLPVWVILVQKIKQTAKTDGLNNVNYPHQISHQLSTKTDNAPLKFSVWKNKTAWCMGVFFGLQSLLFYSVASFLSSIAVSYGLSDEKAGLVVLAFQLSAPVAIFLITVLIKRNFSIQAIGVASAILNAIGAFGLIAFPDLLYFWSAIMGFGGSAIFTLVLMLFSIKTSSLDAARDLSGMVQVVGYLLAFFGPLVLGILFEKTQHWQVSLWVLFGLMMINIVFAWFVGGADKIDTQKTP